MKRGVTREEKEMYEVAKKVVLVTLLLFVCSCGPSVWVKKNIMNIPNAGVQNSAIIRSSLPAKILWIDNIDVSKEYRWEGSNEFIVTPGSHYVAVWWQPSVNTVSDVAKLQLVLEPGQVLEIQIKSEDGIFKHRRRWVPVIIDVTQKNIQ
jgi:hypothetical protein